jgi:hypothetical protein
MPWPDFFSYVHNRRQFYFFHGMILNMNQMYPHEENNWRHGLTASDNVGSGPTMSDQARPGRTMSGMRREEHTFTTFEALKFFEQQGLPRSQRAIERYCKSEKLDCFFDPDEQRYYITQASIERLIGHLKELQARHERLSDIALGPTVTDTVGQGPTTSDHVRSSPAAPEEQPKASAESEREKDKYAKELELENRDLKINNRAKDLFIEQLQKDRENFVREREHLINRLVDSTKQIGVLETKLMQLEAPKERTPMIGAGHLKPETQPREFAASSENFYQEPQEVSIAESE